MKDKEKCVVCNKDITNELPKIDVNGNHYCSNCYLEKCKKELEGMEMAKDLKNLASIIRDVLVNRTDIGYIPDLAFPIAKEVLKHYQPKLPENSVVISKEEYIKNFNTYYFMGQREVEAEYKTIQIPRERKETAEKIIKWFKENSVCIPSDEYINEFAKQFGIEIKE